MKVLVVDSNLQIFFFILFKTNKNCMLCENQFVFLFVVVVIVYLPKAIYCTMWVSLGASIYIYILFALSLSLSLRENILVDTLYHWHWV